MILWLRVFGMAPLRISPQKHHLRTIQYNTYIQPYTHPTPYGVQHTHKYIYIILRLVCLCPCVRARVRACVCIGNSITTPSPHPKPPKEKNIERPSPFSLRAGSCTLPLCREGCLYAVALGTLCEDGSLPVQVACCGVLP